MQTIARAGKDLMIKEPFYGFYLLHLNKKFSDKLPTAGVYLQGINVGLDINKEFWHELPENKRVGVLKHELLHICFFHLQNRSRYPDHQLYNIAADLEINQHITREDLPEEGMFLDKFKDIKLERHKGTAYYYEELRKNLQKPRNPNNQCSCNGKGKKQNSSQQQSQSGNDSSQNQQGQGNQEGQQGSSGVPDPNCPMHGTGKGGNSGNCQSQQKGNKSNGSTDGNFRDPFLDQVYQKPMHETWKHFDELSDAEKKLVKQQNDHILKEAAKTAQKSHGTIPSELKKYIDELLTPAPPVFDWKAYLRRFIGGSQEIYTKKSKRKLSKRFVDNPGLKIRKKQRLLVAIDTSGSIAKNELAEFFSEIYHIWKLGVAVTIVECDARIGDVYEYKGKFRGHITGGGGTSFQPVVDYFNKHSRDYNSLVYFTDGYAGTPTRPRKQMMWVISSNGKKNYAELPGIVIQIPEKNEKNS